MKDFSGLNLIGEYMPYIISPKITSDTQGEWLEGNPYTKENLYSIKKAGLPPVNYDGHTLKPHSLSHIETPLHTQENGKPIDYFFETNPKHFYGRCIVLKFKNDNWNELEGNIKLKTISKEELQSKLSGYTNIEKVLITVEGVEKNRFGYHDPSFVLVLSLEAAEYLTSFVGFNLFGTSWKSTDFSPGSSDRPIHNKIFEKALILEYIDLSSVPEGEYFLNCFPLNLEGASESPVTAVLFEKNEISG